MKIQVVAVGKLKERFWKEACDEYLKRLKGYAKVRVDEVPDCDPAKVGGEEGARTKEGRSILEKLPEHSHVILLDVGGRQLSSEGIAARVDALALSGVSWHVWCCSSKSIGHSKSRVASRIINNWLRRSAERRNCSTLRRVLCDILAFRLRFA